MQNATQRSAHTVDGSSAHAGAEQPLSCSDSAVRPGHEHNTEESVENFLHNHVRPVTLQLDFGKRKKKKSKAKRDSQAPGLGAVAAAAGLANDNSQNDGANELECGAANGSESITNRGTDAGEGPFGVYAWSDLYERCAVRLKEMHGGERSNKKTTLRPPVLTRPGGTSWIWQNFEDTARALGRDPDHVKTFVLVEMSVTGSINQCGALVIRSRARVQSEKLLNLVTRYIKRFVQCGSCHSGDTFLGREKRMEVLKCSTCGSSRVVSKIESGYVATTRASRRDARG